MKILSAPCPEGGRLLLHLCCAPDAAYGVPALGALFRVTGFFFNPNVRPAVEASRRLAEAFRLREQLPFPLEVAAGEEAAWEEAVRGLEGEPERGRRCEACIRFRLARTARTAKAGGYDAYGTVLTVSPKKDAAAVNRIGREEGERTGVPFLAADLKKGDGFARSVAASRALGLYRQRHCGCRFSAREDP